MAKRANWRKVKRHRSYTVDEISRLFSISKGTARRWLKNGLDHISDRKPILVLGDYLIEFLQNQSRKSRKCELDECFCFSCRAPKRAAFGEVEITTSHQTSANMHALCETCSTRMFKRVSLANLEPLRAILKVSIKHAGEPISNSPSPCLNDHLQKEANL